MMLFILLVVIKASLLLLLVSVEANEWSCTHANDTQSTVCYVWGSFSVPLATSLPTSACLFSGSAAGATVLILGGQSTGQTVCCLSVEKGCGIQYCILLHSDLPSRPR
jgi:hypothetical protein